MEPRAQLSCDLYEANDRMWYMLSHPAIKHEGAVTISYSTSGTLRKPTLTLLSDEAAIETNYFTHSVTTQVEIFSKFGEGVFGMPSLFSNEK